MRPWTVAVLACQQSLTLAFVSLALPVVLRQQGASLAYIGLFGLVFLAFTFNFLWAPLVDRLRLTRLGRRRSWLLLTQVANVTLLVLLSLYPVEQRIGLLLLCVLLAVTAATQRVATLGYVAETFGEARRSLGSALMGWGGGLGNLLGGALGLYLVERLGWQAAVLTLAALSLLMSLSLFSLAEPQRPRTPHVGWLPRTFVRREVWWAVLLIAPSTLGIAMAFAMAQPRLVDLGFGMGRIGLTVGLIHLLAFSLFGPLLAAFAPRLSPLRGTCWIALGLLPLFLLLGLLDTYLEAASAALLAVLLVFAALALQNILYGALFFALASPGEAATDVTFLQAMTSALALLGFALSGLVAERFGYSATLLLAGLGYAASACLALALRGRLPLRDEARA